jgi:hypothetical protein
MEGRSSNYRGRKIMTEERMSEVKKQNGSNEKAGEISIGV